MTTLEANVISDVTKASKGQTDSYISKNYNVSKSEEWTKKLAGRTLYSTGDTYIYKGAEMVLGWTDASIKYKDAVKVESGKAIGKVKAVFYRKENSATNFPNYDYMPYVLLDYPGYFRIVPFATKFVSLTAPSNGGGGGGNNTTPTDTTTDSTTDSGSKFNIKKILPIAGAFVVFGVVIFWDKLTGKKRGKK